ncbi:MAG: hypothetical protein ACR2FN_02585 [Chitinophagaceae bacterium]
MVNKIIFSVLISVFYIKSFSQNLPPTYSGDDGSKGFKKENVFIGGSLSVGFASDIFSVGGNPEIGYSIAQWLDAGIAINLNYSSERADPYYNYNVRTRSFNYGGGIFIRAYPVRFLFLELQPEENWIHQTQKDFNSGLQGSITVNSTSLIGGIGYTQRIVGQASFYTLIGIDLLNNIYSPYRDYNGAVVPIIRAGFDFYLHPSRRK